MKIMITLKQSIRQEQNLLKYLVWQTHGVKAASPVRRATVETLQMTCISYCSDKLYLSRKACIALGIISDILPTIGETHGSAITDILDNNDSIAYSNTSQTATCSDGTSLYYCPKRELPPAIPTEFPFEACEDNRQCD